MDNPTDAVLTDAPGVDIDAIAVTAGEDESICAICLDNVLPEDLAIIRGCEHLYCACCILRWCCQGNRDEDTCPTCKVPFNYLWVRRQLDGSLSDYLVEESVCLLKRAPWFQEFMRELDHGPKTGVHDWHEGVADPYLMGAAEDEDDYEDDELEDYYFSSAAGRARIVLGNRRWGENGSVRAGRMYARPVNPLPTAAPAPTRKPTAKKASSAEQGSSSSRQATPAAGGTSGAGGSASTSQGTHVQIQGSGSASKAHPDNGGQASSQSATGADTSSQAAVPATALQQVGSCPGPAAGSTAAISAQPQQGPARKSGGRKGVKGPGTVGNPAAAAAAAAAGEGLGRRAKRNQRRAIADYEDYY